MENDAKEWGTGFRIQDRAYGHAFSPMAAIDVIDLVSSYLQVSGSTAACSVLEDFLGNLVNLMGCPEILFGCLDNRRPLRKIFLNFDVKCSSTLLINPNHPISFSSLTQQTRNGGAACSVPESRSPHSTLISAVALSRDARLRGARGPRPSPRTAPSTPVATLPPHATGLLSPHKAALEAAVWLLCLAPCCCFPLCPGAFCLLRARLLRLFSPSAFARPLLRLSPRLLLRPAATGHGSERRPPRLAQLAHAAPSLEVALTTLSPLASRPHASTPHASWPSRQSDSHSLCESLISIPQLLAYFVQASNDVDVEDVGDKDDEVGSLGRINVEILGLKQ
ncbi:hypothetical protein Syun_031284 [Stephania yunnanensis]|uniref:Uncharacterized protein n=1 Tax=Stephania yunnanensis TaxID=152371 RepID=A0AAP0DWI2_9MAGN